MPQETAALTLAEIVSQIATTEATVDPGYFHWDDFVLPPFPAEVQCPQPRPLPSGRSVSWLSGRVDEGLT